MMSTFARPDYPVLDWLGCLCVLVGCLYGCGVGPSCCASHSRCESFEGLNPAQVCLFFTEVVSGGPCSSQLVLQCPMMPYLPHVLFEGDCGGTSRKMGQTIQFNSGSQFQLLLPNFWALPTQNTCLLEKGEKVTMEHQAQGHHGMRHKCHHLMDRQFWTST